ncbi:MAG: tol-pal system-associated acyl-CoA thioesterase [Burkholderiaceae bacterium]|nr:MAG: tol-pal system-associated acyl-CoA thioesterase [Burkholderiaceae bacterium]
MFTLPIRVYYEDTDAGGVVYYANYLKFYERARTEWLRQLDVDQVAVAQELDTVFAVRHIEVDYLRAARLDDQLTVTVTVKEMRRATIVFEQSILRGEEAVSKATVKICCMSPSKLSACEIPPFIRERLPST